MSGNTFETPGYHFDLWVVKLRGKGFSPGPNEIPLPAWGRKRGRGGGSESSKEERDRSERRRVEEGAAETSKILFSARCAGWGQPMGADAALKSAALH